MKQLTFLFLILSAIIFSSCNDSSKKSKDSNASDESTKIYFNGDIITMEGESPQYLEAIVEANGKIIFKGDLKTAENKYKNAGKFDLDGKTLLPGFIEPHLHPSLAAIMLQNEIIAPYDWKLPSGTKEGVQGEQAYRSRISESIRSNASPDQIYFIWGYHQLWHGELSRDLLNEIAGNQPVGIIHRSFHEIYLNDAAIAKLGIKESDFKDNPQVEWSKGHFFEGGWLALVPKMAPILLGPNSYLKGLSTMSELLHQNGITTIARPGIPCSDFDGG
ncbi:amidohydrolase family protein, partial [Tenacibaculum sp. L6]|uniref:amidohydrolase family protein n=1 Tax=Tenacibaculum sp. L6 TaxID=2992764 RepID=UPI00237AB0A2